MWISIKGQGLHVPIVPLSWYIHNQGSRSRVQVMAFLAQFCNPHLPWLKYTHELGGFTASTVALFGGRERPLHLSYSTHKEKEYSPRSKPRTGTNLPLGTAMYSGAQAKRTPGPLFSLTWFSMAGDKGGLREGCDSQTHLLLGCWKHHTEVMAAPVQQNAPCDTFVCVCLSV